MAHHRLARPTVIIMLLCLGLTALVWGTFASPGPATYAASLAQATPAAPDAVGTSVPAVPDAVGTSNPDSAPAVPNAVETSNAAGTSNQPSDAGSVSGTTTQLDASGGFPWWLVALLALVLLGGVALAMSRRSRQTVTATDYAAPAAPGANRGAYVGPAQPYAKGRASSAGTAAPFAASAASAGAIAAPSTLECPNCGATNSIDENFCHDCGQDLRPTRAAVMPPTPPPTEDLVTDYTPYLETLDRLDEQLEYVLSRPRVMIGAAQGNDITIDSAFGGWETVSPSHAELRQEQEGFVIVDSASENGTFVNETRTGENILADGDIIRLGAVRFVYRVPQIEG